MKVNISHVEKKQGSLVVGRAFADVEGPTKCCSAPAQS